MSSARKGSQLREVTHGLVEHFEVGEEQDQCPDIDSGCADADEAEAEAIPGCNVAANTNDDNCPKHDQHGNEWGELGLQPASSHSCCAMCSNVMSFPTCKNANCVLTIPKITWMSYTFLSKGRAILADFKAMYL